MTFIYWPTQQNHHVTYKLALQTHSNLTFDVIANHVFIISHCFLLYQGFVRVSLYQEP